MRFAFTEEQAALQRAARTFLQSASSPARVRAAMSRPAEGAEAWARASRELGWASLPFAEQHGGAGFGWVEVAAVIEECGRALFVSPLFATVCLAGAAVLFAATEEQKAELLPAVASGDRTATLAFGDGEGWSPGDVTGTFEPDGQGGYLVSGDYRFVLDGASADLLVCAARGRGESGPLALFALGADQPGVRRTPTPTLDLTRPVASVSLEQARVPARARLGGEADAAPALARALDTASAMLACEQVGAADACLEMAVSYARIRKQFGRPIGSFQAIKHACADMLLDVETARSAAYYAAWAASDAPDDLPAAAAQANAVATEALSRCAARNIQIHGGIGFTWEHDAHLYFKRARGSRSLLGSPSALREAFAAHLGLLCAP